MAPVVSGAPRSRSRGWMMRGGLTVAAGIALLVSSFLGGALMAHVFEFGEPGLTLIMEKLVHSVGGRVPAAGIALALLFASQWLRGKRLRVRQEDYDLTGQQIVTGLRANPGARVPDFYLYLRAFETTGKLHVPFYLRLRRKCIWVGQQLVTDDLESYITVAVGRRAPLIALGRPGEAVGAGRILTEDESWKADIVTLMRRAKGILLVPSDRDGTTWEIDALRREGLFGKVVFIMPPLCKGEYDTGARWAAARRAMAALSLEAPEHQDRGMLFRLGPDGALLNVEPLILSSPRRVHRSLDRIFKAPQGKRIYQAIVRADKLAGRAAFWGWLENARLLSVFPVVALAVLIPAPNVGFDPGESWATVLQRSFTMEEIARYDGSQLLASSAKYQRLKAAAPPGSVDQLNQALLLRGLARLDPADLRAYFVGLGDMLARVSERSCAEIASGESRPGTMDVARTYIPSDRVIPFLHAGTAAIVAAAEDAPLADLDEHAEALAWQQFTGSLDPIDSLRYREFDQKTNPSAADRCWLLRTMYGAVGRFKEPQATLWATVVAKMSFHEPSPGPPGPSRQEPPERTDPHDPPRRPGPLRPSPARKPLQPDWAAIANREAPQYPVRGSQTPQSPEKSPDPAMIPPAPQTNVNDVPPSPPSPHNPAPAVDPSVAMLERARLAMDRGNLVEPANDCALYWAMQLTQNGSPLGAELERSVLGAMNKRILDARAGGNYVSAIGDLNKLILLYPARTDLVTWRSQIQTEQQRAAAEAQIKKFILQHRHIIVGNNGAMLQAYCVGVLVVLPDSTARFDCTNTLDPQGRCDHVVFAPGAVKSVKFMANGLLHVATNRLGNYDFYGDSAALQGAYQGLGVLAGR